ncbi:hypothetical protein SELMODRAFT_85806 [Selaginella moellendorffii]|uniref:F-box domain-containing protein n=1 Tax=Selaginella moellendorffii TaxID=88036 RepID=D8R4X1_SELML|nr:F-box/kelch-repeat protein At1g22040 [Selaginella moellendorffii]EFJ32389.1 hypothetical protein SELMODRAFT_85806 [Selaginella moellendorffii]|eukprot:XP_002966362.1 F-box/kelch-repeat protein At1g22040 [Selaginella moellendorffii]
MGASWSSADPGGNSRPGGAGNAAAIPSIGSSGDSSKRQRRIAGEHQWQLIPGLPDEVAMHALARVPRSWHPAMKLVCSSWRQVMSSSEIFRLRRELGVVEEWLYVLMKDKEEELVWFALDPLTAQWRRLPPMPDVDHHQHHRQQQQERDLAGWSLWELGSSISGMVRSLFGKKDSSERIPFFGCSAAELHGCLFVLGGFSKASATSSVWKYDPRTDSWSKAAAMGTARAYCKTGLVDGNLYAVGGVNRGRNGLTPLQSAEVYDPEADAWSAIPSMPFVGAQVLPTAFVTDILKPIATGMAAFRGKLWVPQSLYSWPFFVDVGGEVFDPVSGRWEEMPRGMGEGWPARQAGMKLSVVVNGSLFSLDPMSTAEGSKIKVYDFEQDCWRVVVRKVPMVLDLSTESESPYLLGCLRSGLHVVTKDAGNNVTILRAEIDGGRGAGDSEAESWTVIASKSFGRVELVACQVLEI